MTIDASEFRGCGFAAAEHLRELSAELIHPCGLLHDFGVTCNLCFDFRIECVSNTHERLVGLVGKRAGQFVARASNVRIDLLDYFLYVATCDADLRLRLDRLELVLPLAEYRVRGLSICGEKLTADLEFVL